jgi:L-2,4-diaminobutyrate decarboxylase
MPLSAGMVLVQRGKDLERAFAQSAPYLFHGAESEVELSPDLGKRSFQCSRRADALKVWVGLQRFGVHGIGAMYDALCESAVSLLASLRAQDGLTPLHEPQSNIVAWAVRDTAPQKVAQVRSALNLSEAAWITSTSIDGVSCLRVTMMNPRSTDSDRQRLITALH